MSSKILKHTFIFSFFVILAQVIGLVRDIYLLRYFGPGNTLDAYYLAFKIPDFLNLFYSVLLGSVILIPLLTKVLHEEGEVGVQKQVNHIFTFVMFLVTFGSIVIYFLMPSLASFLAPSWTIENQMLLSDISRWLLLAQLFFPIGIMFGAISMVYEKPLSFASAGAVYNIFILLGSIFLTPIFGIYGVVYGVIAGSFLFMLVQIGGRVPRKYFLKIRPSFHWRYSLDFISKNVWRFISVFMNQFFAVMVATLAALSGTGGVTLFSNSYNIYMAIFFAFGASFATAIMPHVSRLHVSGQHEEVKDSLTNSVVNVFSLSIYVSIFIFIFAPEIVGLLYYFSNLTTIEEAHIIIMLQLLAFSLPTLNILDVVRKYMYTTDMAYESIYVMLTFVPFIYVSYLVLEKYFDPKMYALALSITIANILCAIFILMLMYKKRKIFGKKTFTSILVSTFISILVLTILNIFLGILSFDNIFIGILAKFMFTLFLSLVAIYVLNDKIMKEILEYVTKKIFFRKLS